MVHTRVIEIKLEKMRGGYSITYYLIHCGTYLCGLGLLSEVGFVLN